jgi:hypothetical protein
MAILAGTAERGAAAVGVRDALCTLPPDGPTDKWTAIVQRINPNGAAGAGAPLHREENPLHARR